MELSPEYKTIAELLFKHTTDLDKKQKLDHRIKMIVVLWKICQVTDAPVKRRLQFPNHDWDIVSEPKPEPTSSLIWTPMML